MNRTIALIVVFLLPSLLLAQETEKPLTPEGLADQQHEVGVHLKKIEDTMNRIAKILASRDPERAARLRMAWQRSLDDRNMDKIREIENLLKAEYFNQAFDQQKDLEAALERLLDILLDRDAERKDLKDKIEKLESLSEGLNKIIEEERGHYHKTDKFANPEKALQRAAAAKAKLADLIERQQKLIGKTRAPHAQPGLDELAQKLDRLRKDQAGLRDKKDAAAQKALADQAAKLAQEIAKLAEGLPPEAKRGGAGGGDAAEQAAKATARAADNMGRAAAKMQGGGDCSGEQGDAEGDLREAAEALKRLQERTKRHADKRLEAEQERIRKDAQRLMKELERLEKSAPGHDSGSGDVAQAQQDMSEAGKSLSKSARKQAIPKEEQAKAKLQQAYEKLKEFEKELKRLIELPDYKKLAKEQDDTTEKTDDLLKKMKEQGGQQDPSGGGQPTPGQGGVEGAKKAMDRASRDLRGRSARDANRAQKEAIERLEKAREELEEALRQLREEEQLMLLDALERRLVRMLQKQRQVFKDTIALNLRLKEAKKPARADIDKSRKLSEDESGLALEAEKILEILREEGTTIVIPDVVVDLKGDLDNLAVRLGKLQAGAYTQQIQQDVIATLKELIEVIQEERDRRQGGGQGGDDPMEGDQPPGLLPTSAELKMLRSLQLRVNRRTSDFDRMRVKEDEERTRIAGKQNAVGELTRTMADKLNQEEE